MTDVLTLLLLFRKASQSTQGGNNPLQTLYLKIAHIMEVSNHFSSIGQIPFQEKGSKNEVH